MYDRATAGYYDRLYEGKDYAGEVRFVLDAWRRHGGVGRPRVLDFGCGTGRHSQLIADEAEAVLGVDLAEAMIAQAMTKIGERRNLRFACADVTQLPEGDFDLAICMFNVVSHLQGIATLRSVMSALHARVKPGGLLVFDFWNGPAVLRDPPQSSLKTQTSRDGTRFEIDTRATLDAMALTVDMSSTIRVQEPTGKTAVLRGHYAQYLWMPRTLTEVLTEIGFRPLAVNRTFSLDTAATEKDWKAVLLAQRI